MNYTSLFSPHNIAALHDWLSERGELYIRLEYPHSGGSGTSYLIRTLQDLKQVMAQQTHPEIEIFIFRQLIFPIRGIADESLLERALKEIPDQQYYTIALLDYYPSDCKFLADGKGHLELRKDFIEVWGKSVAVGTNPLDLDYIDNKWIYTSADEIMYFTVRKNRNYYERYDKSPDRYKEVIDLWQEHV